MGHYVAQGHCDRIHVMDRLTHALNENIKNVDISTLCSEEHISIGLFFLTVHHFVLKMSHV